MVNGVEKSSSSALKPFNSRGHLFKATPALYLIACSYFMNFGYKKGSFYTRQIWLLHQALSSRHESLAIKKKPTKGGRSVNP